MRPAWSTPRWPCSCSRCSSRAGAACSSGPIPSPGGATASWWPRWRAAPTPSSAARSTAGPPCSTAAAAVREVRSGGADGTLRPSAQALRGLARLAATAAATYGGPQDLEWAVDHDGSVVLLQARPITTLVPSTGLVFGPGPVAESFPEPLATLEQDLWLEPLRDGLREALLLTGIGAPKAISKSPLVVAVDGMAAADLAAIGADTEAGGLFRRIDPRPPARRLRAAWRVGRLRHALPQLAADLVHEVDADLLDVPELDDLSNPQLLAVLRNGRHALVSVHGHEALAGLLIPEASAATVTGASLALSALAQARAEGVSLCDLVERDPVVLALVPPRIGPAPMIAALDGMELPPVGPVAAADEPDPSAIAREALRLRVRWLQELMARTAWELGRRLVDVGLLPTHDAVRHLTLDELTAMAQRRQVPADLAERTEPAGQVLPSRFRLTDDGIAMAVLAGKRRGRRGAGSGAVGAGGGVGRGPVHVGRHRRAHGQRARDRSPRPAARHRHPAARGARGRDRQRPQPPGDPRPRAPGARGRRPGRRHHRLLRRRPASSSMARPARSSSLLDLDQATTLVTNGAPS